MKNILLLLIIILAAAAAGCVKEPEERFRDAHREFVEGNITKTVFHENLISFVKTESFERKKTIYEDTAIYQKSGNRVRMLYPWRFTIILEHKADNLSIASCETLQTMVLSHRKGIIVFNNRGIETGRYETYEDSKKTIYGAAPFGEGAIFYEDDRLYLFDPSTSSVNLFRDSKFTPHYRDYFIVQIIDTEKILYLVYGSVGLYKITAINLTDDSTEFGGMNAASYRVFAENGRIYFIDGAIGDWTLKKREISPSVTSNLKSFNNLKDILLFENGYFYQTPEGMFISRYDGTPSKIDLDWKIAGKYRSNLIFTTDDKDIMADSKRIFEAFNIAEDLLIIEP